jgi:chemotaxis protein methyltransferase CheR
MLLRDEGLEEWKIQILGTDFSSQVLARARAGRYQQVEVNRGLSPVRLSKYFRCAGVQWTLNDEVRQMVRFEHVDLRSSLRALGPFDLVLCRNVLIYFDSETKAKILKELHGTLCQGGWLLLGGAETAFGVEELFERRTIGSAAVLVAR